MKKRWMILALALSFSMLWTACNKEETTPDNTEIEESEKEELTPEELSVQKKLDMIEPAAYNNAKGLDLEAGAYISVLGKGASGEYWGEVEKGVKKAEEDLNVELGYEGKDKVKVTFSGPKVKDDVTEQVSILDEELARYPIALAISIVDVQACEVQFDLATESGIPLVAFDSGSDYQGLLATATTNNKAAGKMAASKLGNVMEEKGEILIFSHGSQSQAALDRVKGFQAKIKEEFPEIEIAKTIQLDDTEELKEKIAEELNEVNQSTDPEEELTAEDITQGQVVEYVLEQYPDVRGCFATNGDAVELVVEGLEEKKKENAVKVIGFDANDYEIEALKEGKIHGLIVQNPYGMGYASVIAAARAALGLGNEAYINTGHTWVTKDNLSSEEIQSVLYF